MTPTDVSEPTFLELLTSKWQQKLYLIWLIILGAIKALIPFSWMRKKTVAGKNILITGGGSGIGRLVAHRLAKLNARIIIWDINQNGAHEVAQECKSMGTYEPIVFAVNLADRDAVYETAKKTLDQVGIVDILFNNAGIVAGGPFLNIPDEKKELVMTVNAISHWWTIKAFLPKMIEQRSGHIVTIASAAGFMGCPELVDYCSSKFAAFGTHEALTLELDAMGCGRSQGQVYTTVICPSFIDTGMFHGVKAASALVPILQPDFVADSIVNAVLTNTVVLALPRGIYFLNNMKSYLSVDSMLYAADALGINQAMSGFTGRAGVKH